MQSVPGYSGFRRERDKEPVCEKPGDAPSVRDSKFARAGNSVVYSHGPSTFGATAISTTHMTTNYVKPDHYRVPDKRGVMADVESRLPKPVRFVGRSIAQSTFTNYSKQVRRLEEYTPEEFQAAFNAIDTDGSGFIDKREIRPLLCKLYGTEPDDREILTFLAYFDENKDGKISREEFARNVGRVVHHMKVTNKTGGKRHLAAPWAVDRTPQVIGPGDRKSTQQTDVGMDGDNPLGRNLMKGTGMNTTTMDLCDGTSKVTKHLPGYGGYIPQAHRAVSTAQDQAQGTKTRNVFHAKTHLLLTVNDAPPGYTGHRPLAPEHMGLDRHQGGPVLTEKSAADRVVLDYWKARGAKLA